MRVAVAQTDPELSAVGRNLEVMTERIHGAGADLVVFPECALTGYGFESKEAALEVAQPVPGPATQELVSACRAARCLAIAGLLERDGTHLFNAAVLVGPDGLIGRYRKMHLPFIGADRFATPGDLGFPVFTTPLARIGILICYDLSFPEAARALRLGGAQVICVSTNWPLAAEVSCAHAPFVRAQENHVWVVTADRAGTEAGFTFRGESRIVAPDGRALATAGQKEETLHAEIDPALSDETRIVHVSGAYEIDRIADRRPEHYGLVVGR